MYSGRTWHGILEGKVLCPDAGQDYLVLSGEANTVLSGLITRMGLGTLFEAEDTDSKITIKSYQMDRYIGGYTGIRKMLKAVKAKLKMIYKSGKVQISAIPLVDYSQDKEWDSTQISAQISKNDFPTNHVICLGKGELKDRKVIHLYMDAKGKVSKTQTYFGLILQVVHFDKFLCFSKIDIDACRKRTDHSQLLYRTCLCPPRRSSACFR